MNDFHEVNLFDGGLRASRQSPVDSSAWVVSLPAAQGAKQLLVVAGLSMTSTAASVSLHERSGDGKWRRVLSSPGFVGERGLCPDGERVEGNRKTPIGVYRVTRAFGIAPDPGCALPYTQVDGDWYWSGDPNCHYNEMVRLSEHPELDVAASEHLIDYDYPYQYCLNIGFNEACVPGRGAAIFLHCFGQECPYTGGCVSVPENIMKGILQCVREDCVVVIDTVQGLNAAL